ncbi:hypothetical protein CLF_101467, partial [Clonorchis sinensis]
VLFELDFNHESLIKGLIYLLLRHYGRFGRTFTFGDLSSRRTYWHAVYTFMQKPFTNKILVGSYYDNDKDGVRITPTVHGWRICKIWLILNANSVVVVIFYPGGLNEYLKSSIECATQKLPRFSAGSSGVLIDCWSVRRAGQLDCKRFVSNRQCTDNVTSIDDETFAVELPSSANRPAIDLVLQLNHPHATTCVIGVGSQFRTALFDPPYETVITRKLQATATLDMQLDESTPVGLPIRKCASSVSITRVGMPITPTNPLTPRSRRHQRYVRGIFGLSISNITVSFSLLLWCICTFLDRIYFIPWIALLLVANSAIADISQSLEISAVLWIALERTLGIHWPRERRPSNCTPDQTPQPNWRTKFKLLVCGTTQVRHAFCNQSYTSRSDSKHDNADTVCYPTRNSSVFQFTNRKLWSMTLLKKVKSFIRLVLSLIPFTLFVLASVPSLISFVQQIQMVENQLQDSRVYYFSPDIMTSEARLLHLHGGTNRSRQKAKLITVIYYTNTIVSSLVIGQFLAPLAILITTNLLIYKKFNCPNRSSFSSLMYKPNYPFADPCVPIRAFTHILVHPISVQPHHHIHDEVVRLSHLVMQLTVRAGCCMTLSGTFHSLRIRDDVCSNHKLLLLSWLSPVSGAFQGMINVNEVDGFSYRKVGGDHPSNERYLVFCRLDSAAYRRQIRSVTVVGPASAKKGLLMNGTTGTVPLLRVLESSNQDLRVEEAESIQDKSALTDQETPKRNLLFVPELPVKESLSCSTKSCNGRSLINQRRRSTSELCEGVESDANIARTEFKNNCNRKMSFGTPQIRRKSTNDVFVSVFHGRNADDQYKIQQFREIFWQAFGKMERLKKIYEKKTRAHISAKRYMVKVHSSPPMCKFTMYRRKTNDVSRDFRYRLGRKLILIGVQPVGKNQRFVKIQCFETDCRNLQDYIGLRTRYVVTERVDGKRYNCGYPLSCMICSKKAKPIIKWQAHSPEIRMPEDIFKVDGFRDQKQAIHTSKPEVEVKSVSKIVKTVYVMNDWPEWSAVT